MSSPTRSSPRGPSPRWWGPTNSFRPRTRPSSGTARSRTRPHARVSRWSWSLARSRSRRLGCSGVECAGEYAWDIECSVSKGTYIRALARDLGRALNTAAHLGALRRTRSGGAICRPRRTHSRRSSRSDGRRRALLRSDHRARPAGGRGLRGDRRARAPRRGDRPRFVRRGRDSAPDAAVSVAREGVLLGVYGSSGGQLKPQAIIPGGVRGAS